MHGYWYRLRDAIPILIKTSAIFSQIVYKHGEWYRLRDAIPILIKTLAIFLWNKQKIFAHGWLFYGLWIVPFNQFYYHTYHMANIALDVYMFHKYRITNG